MVEANVIMEKATEEEASQTSDEGQLVVFKLGDVEFGADINNVKEIVRLPEITPIPRSPEYVSGICNLRGSVLPVIDTRTRFAMDTLEATEQSRLLVVESAGQSTGLIVDGMREVMRMSGSLVEATPSVCKGVDKEFLDGVVKMEDGKRLILMLKLAEVMKIDINMDAKKAEVQKTRIDETIVKEDATEEEQLVSFKVAGEEYAFVIETVREILRVTEVTSVPNVAEYVKGLFTIRNQLMPIVDLRTLMGKPDQISEHYNVIDRMIDEHEKWAASLRNSIENGESFNGTTDHSKCSLGQWIEHYNTSSTEIQNILNRLKKPHAALHNSAGHVIELTESSKDDALNYFEKEVKPVLETMMNDFAELKGLLERSVTEDQRVLVVETGNTNIGYLVDSVDEVVRIPKSVIDETPGVAASERKELKGVAKLNEGERLIMIMDESSLISTTDSQALSKITSEGNEKAVIEDNTEKSLAEQSLEEEQLVTFLIGDEEYGVPIMEVQEINRIEQITSVPRAPYFVDGLTNLRGNVIPVINIRKLFDMEPKEHDERTRIIIVDIGGNKTGLKVDRVNEVLRLSKSDIEETPSIVTSGAGNRFMDGVCKLDDGKRMVVRLDAKKILNKKELKSLTSMGDQPKTEDGNESKKPEKTEAPKKKKLEIAE